LCDDAGSGESIHVTSDFAKHVAVGVNDVTKVVIVDDVLGEQVKLHPKVLLPRHWRHEVEIFEVYRHEPRIHSGYDDVEQ
jgi:hypothetical protein